MLSKYFLLLKSIHKNSESYCSHSSVLVYKGFYYFCKLCFLQITVQYFTCMQIKLIKITLALHPSCKAHPWRTFMVHVHFTSVQCTLYFTAYTTVQSYYENCKLM